MLEYRNPVHAGRNSAATCCYQTGPVMPAPSVLRPLVLIALATLLSACAGILPPRDQPAPVQASVPAAEAPAVPAAPAPAPSTEPQRATTTPPTARPPAAPPAAVLPAVPNDPVMLVGLTQEQANAMLGPPLSIRQETPATVWAYRIGDCQLDLFFYEDVKTKRQQSLAYELQTREKTDQAQRACFNRIWTAKNGR
jgi:hypothetical protein